MKYDIRLIFNEEFDLNEIMSSIIIKEYINKNGV